VPLAVGLVMDVATLTAKGQLTVLKAVRDALGLRQGDQLSWELEDGSVRVRAVALASCGKKVF
jgi:antitoxin PrlF